jgi:uncharacterized iron-regulated membrane protein
MVKKYIRPLHLFCGLIIGLIVFTVSITGALYAFEEECRNLLYQDVLVITETPAPSKPLSELAEAAKKGYPESKLKNIRIKADKGSSAEFLFADKRSVYINPYTASILGTTNKETDFFGVVLKIHRTLYLGDTGKIITGTSATIFVCMLLTGIILWWPKQSTSRKQKFSILRNAQWKRRNYDLHSVLGFYASWIIIFTALTGMIWSFKWAENSMYWLSRSKKEDKKHFSTYKADATSYSLDRVVEMTRKLSPGSNELFFSLPQDSTAPIRAIVRYPHTGLFRKQDQLYFDQYSGSLLGSKLYTTSSSGDRLRAANYDIHTGKVLGLVGQLLVFFAALISASLPITGFLLWRGRMKKG